MNDGDQFEEHLRARFRAMSEDEARRAPPFARVVRTGRERRALPRAWRGAITTAAVVAVAVLTWVVRSAWQEVEARRALARWHAVSASTRTMPTDFLLDTPDQALLREVPKLGWDARWSWEVPSGRNHPHSHPSERRRRS